MGPGKCKWPSRSLKLSEPWILRKLDAGMLLDNVLDRRIARSEAHYAELAFESEHGAGATGNCDILPNRSQ